MDLWEFTYTSPQLSSMVPQLAGDSMCSHSSHITGHHEGKQGAAHLDSPHYIHSETGYTLLEKGVFFNSYI